MNESLKEALRDEITFISDCLAYAQDDDLLPLSTLDDASAQVEGYLESFGHRGEVPEALTDPAVMLLVFNWCAEEERARRSRRAAEQALRNQSVSVSDLIDAITKTVKANNYDGRSFLLYETFFRLTGHYMEVTKSGDVNLM